MDIRSDGDVRRGGYPKTRRAGQDGTIRVRVIPLQDLLAAGLEFLRPPQYIKSRFAGKLSRSFMQHESMIASGGQTLHLKVSGRSIKLQPCKSFGRTW